MGLATLENSIIERTADAVTELWRIDKWKTFIFRNDQWYYEFKRGMVGMFEKQEAEVLKRATKKSYAPSAITNWIEFVNKAAEDWLFDEQAWRVTFSEFGQLLLPEIVQDRGEKEIMQLLIGVEFDVENPRVASFLDAKVHKFSFETNNTTIRALKKQFSEALAQGEGIPQIEKRVRHVFGIAKRSRSVNIARTEVVGASNFGAHEAYKQSGVVEKEEWLATKDTKTRDAHAHMDGERKALDDTFSNGLRFPGDPRGTPEQICQCRCTVLPIVTQ